MNMTTIAPEAARLNAAPGQPRCIDPAATESGSVDVRALLRGVARALPLPAALFLLPWASEIMVGSTDAPLFAPASLVLGDACAQALPGALDAAGSAIPFLALAYVAATLALAAGVFPSWAARPLRAARAALLWTSAPLFALSATLHCLYQALVFLASYDESVAELVANPAAPVLILFLVLASCATCLVYFALPARTSFLCRAACWLAPRPIARWLFVSAAFGLSSVVVPAICIFAAAVALTTFVITGVMIALVIFIMLLPVLLKAAR